ncbi:CAMP receptor-like protein [Penicillium manginii]|uniref:CAMP receptor-like protein n=1 Tax=Penicillium manginii TaxID=203109 RepID=UPI0025472DFB|nr:CAMP receptor-like protein [Penicillium manginii]KAJ5763122.1 CAMP receptor-like protein [Penicillium manginii]
MAGPSEEQLFAISITERTCSAISLIGTFVIVATFICSRAFRKPINRLVFYASWGNIMANIATLISQDGIHAGIGSPLCQIQAFLIQWFMPADALWTFAMACNVYLTFFHKYNSDQLRQIEWKYLIFCYGVPLIPAFTYFFIKTEALGRLWCWVSKQWDWLRIATFYGPVWLVIILTFAIYIRAGSVIYQKRRQFRHLGHSDFLDSEIQADSSPLVKNRLQTHAHVNLDQAFQGIQVTSEIAYSVPDERPSLTQGRSHSVTSNYSPGYSVTIQGGRSLSDDSGFFRAEESTETEPESEPRVSIPSSIRPHSQLESRPYPTPGARVSHLEDTHTISSHRRSSAGENTSRAAWAYTKYAMLFFVALLVTWVPSTLNRVYAFARPDEFSFGLNFASSFVLPLQGFWNSVIYVSISWPAFWGIWRGFKFKFKFGGRASAVEMRGR